MLGLFKWIEGELRGWWGVAVGAAYALCFVALRPLSTDQWYLPAGLRVAALLLLPVRLWPFVYLGEVAALIYARTPYIEMYGMAWLWISSVVLLPAVAGIVYSHRKLLATGHVYWFLSVAALSAVVISLLNIATTYYLMHPQTEPVTWDSTTRYIVGDYLGILMIVPMVLLLKQRAISGAFPKNLGRHTAWSLAVVMVLCAILVVGPDLSAAHQHSLRMLMIVPAAVLTFLHGWRGAAIGIAGVNLAIGLTMKRTDVLGTYDTNVFLSQQILALSGTILLGFGSLISRYSSQVRHSGLARREAYAAARSSYAASEREIQRRAKEFLRIGDDLRRAYVDGAQELRNNGLYNAAMDMLNSGAERSKEIRDQLILLFPEEIESANLYRALSSGLIAEAWQRDGHVDRSLRGSADLLSFDLQLAAYRIICDIIGLLQKAGHHNLRLKVRCSRRRARGGIVIHISQANPSGPGFKPEFESLDNAYVAGRVLAYGGIIHRRSHQISVLMHEPTGVAQRLAMQKDSGRRFTN